VSDAREVVLSRIRAALADRPQPSAAVLPPTQPGPADPVALFAERAGAYRAAVHRVDRADVAARVTEICAAHCARRLAVPHDLPEGWLPPDVEATGDATVSALDRVDGVLTGCAAAIAETGTIVLDGGPGQGIRALTLVPDLHICVVPAELVCVSVSEAFQRVEPSVRRRRAPLTLISGPSATSDIELSRVEGVHGPRRLEIVIVQPAATGQSGRSRIESRSLSPADHLRTPSGSAAKACDSSSMASSPRPASAR
jgi:L-lactate dehydrogenase complex protein LldG